MIPTRAVAGWVLFDLANTIFSMGVISVAFPMWVRRMKGADAADAAVGVITSVSMALIFVASPLLGAMTDRARRRMPFLVASTLICVGFTLGMARVGWGWTAVFFIIANVAYQAGLQFYDSMLADVSTEKTRGRIGGLGVGIGYIGSYIAIGAGLLLAGIGPSKDSYFLVYFPVIAGLFLLFALPCFLFVKERGNPDPRPIRFSMIRESTRETWRTLRSGHEFPGLLRFLIGRVFYTDSINTVITFMGIFTTNVAIHSGLKLEDAEQRAQWIYLVAISFAIAGGFVWGWLTDRLGPKRTLNIVLGSWFGVFAAAASVGLFGLPLWTMFAVASAAGFCLGGIWAADRPLMLRLTPPSRIGEFYGLYGMVGRFSAVTGPVLWAGVTSLSVHGLGLPILVGQGASILTLLLFMVVSYLILRPVTDAPRDWAALAASSDRAAAPPAQPTPPTHTAR